MTPPSDRRMRAQWPLFLAVPIAAALIVLLLGAYSLYQSLSWVGRPFPGFFVMENRVVPTVAAYDWPARELLSHARLVAVDASPVSSSTAALEQIAAKPMGTSFTYSFEKRGRRIEETIASRPFDFADYLQTWGLLILFGFASLSMGVAVAFLQPVSLQARIYLLQALVAAVYALTGVFLHQPGFPVLGRICLAAEALFPATFVHLALVFPVQRRLARGAILVPYLLSGIVIALVLFGFDREPPWLWPLRLSYLNIAASVVFFIASTAFAYARDRDPLVRPRIRAVLPGLIGGTALVGFAFASNVFDPEGGIPIQLGLLFPLIFYASIAYAIARHDLFDVDRVVRQSFVYALLSAVVLGAYALVTVAPMQLLPSLAVQHQRTIAIGFMLILALALAPLRRGIQAIVDRAFYRTRLDYQATISDLSEALTSILDVEEIVARVTGVVTDSMHLHFSSLYLRDDDAQGVWVRAGERGLTRRPSRPGFEDLRALLEGAPAEFEPARIVLRANADGAGDDLERLFAELEPGVVLPLLVRGRAIGVLMLGGKRSGLTFESPDIDLLRTLANQTAIALQNARSYRALESLTRDLDEKVRHRTAELHASNSALERAYDELKSAQGQLVQSEKMASLGRLVAGVAHELNNPASFVHGALQNLTEYLSAITEVLEAYEQAPIGDPDTAEALTALRSRRRLAYLLRETPELLRICSEGSERIKRIVDDLKMFVRADLGERVPTPVTEGIDSTLSLLADRIRRGAVRIEKTYGAVPLVAINPGQMNQVWMNLLCNAIDALADRAGGSIRIEVRMAADEREPRVEIEVRDDGSGIRSEDVPRLFEPFFTTKPIGQGTGLGLSIVYGAVKAHQGSVRVNSEVGRGTAFIVSLPVVASANASVVGPAVAQ